MLFDDDASVAKNAAFKLSNIICHQGNAGSIAVPSLPFLLERVESHPPIAVLEELMEIMYWFSHYLEPVDTSQWKSEDWELKKRAFNLSLIHI